MKAIITVVGEDKVGIIASVSGELAQRKVNILDITQTILQNYFTMMMLVELSEMELSLEKLKTALEEIGKRLGVSIRIQHEEIFRTMHRV
ncbi:ACT domain-containing protein [Sediminispirochaeta bajacaliforniensis]|uniref:ACT domain-containing protein n=1 Tax=Sediminispirochaeta bajacaliforniensis TaxID=148 RepID=UPI00036DE9C9|nr:ACT domain-containing protein [Sediminispirochaeta bajacaliforniensis]